MVVECMAFKKSQINAIPSSFLFFLLRNEESEEILRDLTSPYERVYEFVRNDTTMSVPTFPEKHFSG